MKKPFAIVSALSIVTLASPAFAQYASNYGDIDPGLDPGVVGDFTTLDRMSPQSRFGIDLGFSYYDGEEGELFDEPNVLALRMDLHGQFFAANGFGGYASLPITRGIAEDVEDETAVGDLDIGGFAVVDSGSAKLIGRAGVMLATADDEADGLGVNLLGVPGRVGDFYGALPEVTALRLSVSPTFTQGNAFFRADAGIDVAIDEPDGADVDPALRFGAGGGVDTGGTRLMGEIAFVNWDDLSIATAMLSARFGQGSVRPGLSIGTPIYTSEEVEEVYDVFHPVIAIVSIEMVPRL